MALPLEKKLVRANGFVGKASGDFSLGSVSSVGPSSVFLTLRLSCLLQLPWTDFGVYAGLRIDYGPRLDAVDVHCLL